jgi:hypothetical protein
MIASYGGRYITNHDADRTSLSLSVTQRGLLAAKPQKVI